MAAAPGIIPRWFARWSAQTWLLAAAGAAVLRFAAVAAFGSSLPVLVFAQLLHAVSFAAHHAACIATVDRHFPDMRLPACPVLAGDRVRAVGEPVAAVVAETLEQARDAAERIEVDYEPLDCAVAPEAALEPDAARVHDTIAGNRCCPPSCPKPANASRASCRPLRRGRPSRCASAPSASSLCRATSRTE